MTKRYKSPRKFTRADATRQLLRADAARNKAEQHIGSFASEAAKVAKIVRTRLVHANPSLSDADIDEKLNKIMSAGMARTTEGRASSRGVPEDVKAARRAARRQQVKGGRNQRR